MDCEIARGTRRVVDGHARVFYDGYWVRAYDPPADTLQAKKKLIHALTRRLFNHVEHGINVPGRRLGEARAAFDGESDPARKRVKGAMLAGALLNRAAGIFTKIVDLEELGVRVDADNLLMRECGDHLEEALSLSSLVLHRSGEEGLDELWGEPFKAFTFPIEKFYESRYIKIAQTMGALDALGAVLGETFRGVPSFEGVEALVASYVRAAKVKSETLGTDAEIFEVWTSFVVAGERLSSFVPAVAESAPAWRHRQIAEGVQLLRDAKDVIMHVTRARVPMPKTTAALVQRCRAYRSAAVDRGEGDPPERVSGVQTAGWHARAAP